jgi:hypothetical protein
MEVVVAHGVRTFRVELDVVLSNAGSFCVGQSVFVGGSEMRLSPSAPTEIEP